MLRLSFVRAQSSTTDAPVANPSTLAHPSGRFDGFIDMGNPMKGINIFPYLRRRVEGRVLAALGPSLVLELSRTVCEVARPRRWPSEVCVVCTLFAFVYILTISMSSGIANFSTITQRHRDFLVFAKFATHLCKSCCLNQGRNCGKCFFR